MGKSKVLKNIIRKYCLKHGDFIDINTLKFISAKEKIEVNDLMTILGISNSNKKRLRQNPFNKARINIFNKEELKEINLLVKDAVLELENISEKRLDRLCNKYKVNICILNKMLNINKNPVYKLKHGQQFIILKPQNEEKEIINELFIEEVKYKDFVTKELIEYLKQKYKLNDQEICTLLKVQKTNYKNLMQNKTRKMKIDLIDEYEKRKIEETLIEKYKMQDYITKEEIIEIKNEIKTTNIIIKDTLCISTEGFYRIMKDEIQKTRITLKDMNLKMNYLKMDIKYEYGYGFYTSAELRKLCRVYKIDFDDFLKNISTNVNRYKYMKQALKYNKDGLYIGEDHPLSSKFLEKHAKKIQNMCIKITNIYCYSSYLYTERQDISQEAFILIWQKGGIIEKNFSYDEDLLFNLFASKIKYFVIGKRNERYKEVLLDNFNEFIGNCDEYDIFDNDLSMFFCSMDNRIKSIHQHIMKIFLYNKDYIYHNRTNAYKIITYKFKISIEKLEKIIQEISDILLEYGFAKECVDGSILDMSSSEERDYIWKKS